MHTIDCPACGDPLTESANYCARCHTSIFPSETGEQQGEVIPETPISPLSQPGEEEASLFDAVVKEKDFLVVQPVEEIPETPVLVSRDETLSSSDEDDIAATLPITSEKMVDAPAGTDETMPMPEGLSRKLHTVIPAVDTTETMPMPPGLSREPGASPEFAETIPLFSGGGSAGENGRRISRSLEAPTLNLRSMRGNARAVLEQDLREDLGEGDQDDDDDDTVTFHDNWQKVVEHKHSSLLPTLPVAVSEQTPGKSGLFATLLGRRSPRSLAWLGAVVVIALLLSGAFGVAVSLGRTTQKAVPSPILRALPATIALGGIVTLRGSYFPSGANLTLIRDGHIPLVDTSNASTIRTDAHGFFSDTFVVDPAWHPGPHQLFATDPRTHQQASLSLLVTGKDALHGPPHLLLSSASLDLGAGDRYTTSSQQLALSNAGGGQANWQATTSQPWLRITPTSGSIESGSHVSAIVAADRSQLAPGSYQATITFASNSGQAVLAVNLAVTDLQPGHQAILQVSQSTLAFRAAVHGPAPNQQNITISNPGVQPLNWGARVNSSGWLAATPLGGTIQPGGQQQVTVSATPGELGSGVYQGSVSFVNQGAEPVEGSPQSIAVSLTMAPACVLAFTPASLAFRGAQGGLAPAGQALKIGVATGCANQAWKVTTATTTGGSWLTVSSVAGTTPSAVTVSARTTGLPIGTYKGMLSFTSGFGTQVVAVTLTVTATACTVSGAPASLLLQGTAGQAQPVTRNAALSAAAGCQHALTWTSSSSAAWLTATPSGTLTAATPAAVTVAAHLAALPSGPYQGSITIAVIDSVTKLSVGTVTIAVTLNVQIQSTPIVQPSPTPTATAPPSPTPTATPTPTPTAPPSPTATALPTPTPTPTISPSPTAATVPPFSAA